MTYREKLEKEHPERLTLLAWGGCNGCPGTYDYSDDKVDNCPFNGPSPINCNKCWDREIPERKKEAEDFTKDKSYAEFMDGHREEVYYYSMAADGSYLLFATRSGIYFFEDSYEEIRLCNRLAEHTKFKPFLRQRHFYRIRYDVECGILRDSIDYIKTVMIDTRVKHDYCITLKDGGNITGSVLVERGTTPEKIKEAVMDDAVTSITTKVEDA